MTMYVRNNSFLVLSAFLFFFTVSSYGRFNMKATEGDVRAICSKAQNPSFCFNFFKSTPATKTLNLFGVAKLLIDYASRDASNTHKQFNSLLKSAIDPHFKRAYSQCSESYGEAINDFNNALQDLAAKDKESLNVHVTAAMTEGDTCKDELSSIKLSPQLSKTISDFENMSDIVLAISVT